MAIYGWNIVPAMVDLPAAGETVNSAVITVPRPAIILVIYLPTLAAGASVKLQTLSPQPNDQTAESWLDLSAFNLAGGAPIPISAIPGGAATSIPITATGGGVLRLVASSSQAASPVQVPIAFMCL